MHIVKYHLVDDKITLEIAGPYSLIVTQQPLGERSSSADRDWGDGGMGAKKHGATYTSGKY